MLRILVAAVAASLLSAAAAGAAPRVRETPVPSTAGTAGAVRETFVRVHAPLPERAGPRPEACDWVSYLRFRSARGPRRPERADAVAVVMPGYLGGAAYFDQLARNTVVTAAGHGRFVEVWALDRRSNCLEDHTGVRAAAAAEDPSVAYGYYWGGREVDGKRFAGFAAGERTEFLRHVGLEQTVRDWRTVIMTAMPRRADRRRKLVCGGHSLGGPITAAFASFDFDGDPATTRDAGFAQCAAFLGLDTRIALTASGTGVSVSPTTVLGVAGDAQDSPNENTPPLTPETFQLPPVFAVGAFFDPEGTDVLEELPHTTNIDLAEKLLFSRDAVAFAAGPSIRDFTVSNEVTLAGIFDDNSAPLSFLRASVGFLAGGPIAEKDFPTPGDGTLGIPEDPDTPRYRWDDYDETGTAGRPIATNDAGVPFTSRESEISSLRELARTQFEAPANFIEQYFPRALRSDVADASEGNREGGLAHLVHDGPSKRPILLIQAGDSRSNSGADDGAPVVGEPPNGRSLSRRVTLPGYNHNDVLTAAARQNDDRPEPASTELSAYLLRIAGPARIRFARVDVRRRVHVRLAAVEGCRAGVRLRLNGRRVRTDRRGRATLPRRAGTLVARKPGCRTARRVVRVERRS